VAGDTVGMKPLAPPTDIECSDPPFMVMVITTDAINAMHALLITGESARKFIMAALEAEARCRFISFFSMWLHTWSRE
jgi:hypothetical protein